MESGARKGEVLVGGLPYSLVFDRLLRGLHQRAAAQVPEGHSCVDVCCGTGGLTFQIARRAPRVVGVDISPSMIRRAELLRERRGLDHVSFVQGDATDLSHLAVDELDCGAVCMGLHEMPTDVRERVLPELLRVVRRLVIVDFRIPMPRNVAGIRNRVIEFLGGPAHFTGFLDYKRRGGLDALLDPTGATIEHRRTLDAGTLELVVIHR
jgi:SAM-dependent methyltransferase